ncbi:MAG: putative bifunctional diguanylate cyclase/phosphodiesterase [Acidimicrobiales bacterium]
MASPIPTLVDVPWPVALVVLTVAYATAGRLEIDLETDRHSISISMSELVLAVGLVMAGPAVVVSSRVLGGTVNEVMRRQHDPRKVTFNFLLFAAEASIGTALATVIAGGYPVTSYRGWVGVLVTVAVMGALSYLAVATAIRIHGGTGTFSGAARVIPIEIGGSLGLVCLGLAIASMLVSDPAAALLLVPPVALLLYSSRSYLHLAQRQQVLGRLHTYSSRVAASTSVEASVEAALRDAADITRAATAELVLLDAAGSAHLLRYDSETGTIVEVDDPAAPADGTAGTGAATLMTPDHVTVPLVLGERQLGVLRVRQRLGADGAFDDADATVLGAIANHAAVAIENARLIDRLRDESHERERLAHQDALTGLANRRGFTAALRAATERHTATGRRFALVMIDLSRFKDVNDTFGHAAGDRVIGAVADRLRSLTRATDLAARLGGDEYAILLDGAGGTDAFDFSRRAREAIERPVQHDGVSVLVSASIGIACAPDHGGDERALLHHADVALYAAKEDPSRPIQVFDAAKERATNRRHRLAIDLRHALEADEDLDLFYQPKANLETGRLTGAEALLRWKHPELGYVPPDEFVTLAEQTGLINRLTDTVLRRGIGQAGRWAREGLDLGLSLNVSVANLADDGLPQRVRALLEQHAVDPARITLEVTETDIMRDPQRTTQVLARLDQLGVRLSIDDFGTGYSSLAYLKRIPVRELKIDKCFVSDLETNHSDLVIARTVIGLATNLSISTVAEGVESQGTWDILESLGCHQAQGYLLGRPMPATQFEAFLGNYQR